MYLCYLDESGTVEKGGNTGTFVLVGLAVLADSWKAKDAQVTTIKQKYGLIDAEIHTAWLLRDYPEQRVVPDFGKLDWNMRRKAVLSARSLNMARAATRKSNRDLARDYKKTHNFVHLTRDERRAFVLEIAKLLNSWNDIRIFGDAHSKKHSAGVNHFDIAFEQVVTRFNTFLARTGDNLGLLVQDNNETVCTRLTQAMRTYHAQGTLWSKITRIVETPMFVDSELTSMVQLADVCSYATRRFFDNNETQLFDLIRPRYDRNAAGLLVGLRHFTSKYRCQCTVCVEHGRTL
jgi:hypothetical protein